MNKRMMLTIKGKEHIWLFPISANPRYLADWRADGLDIGIITYETPTLIAWLGLGNIWDKLFGRGYGTSTR